MPILGSLGAATAKGVGFTAVPAELPGTPTIGTATVTSGVSVSVSYTAPTFDGNTSILSYTAVAYNYPSGTAAGITGITYGPNSGSVTVSGLTSGAAYTFKVYATNGIGNSGQSGSSNNVTTWVVPTAPTIGAVTYTAGNSFASVAYTQSSSNGGTPVTSYTAFAYLGSIASGQTGILAQATSGSIQVNGLIAGQSYTFKVYATNLVGNSPLSNASSPATSVFTKPDAPIIDRAEYAGQQDALVYYTPPANNGGASITSYTGRAYVNGVATGLSSSVGLTNMLAISNLIKGTTYTFRVTATNTYGTSDPSADSNSITPLTVPGAPNSFIGPTVAATSGTSVNVTFTSSTDTGGNSTYVTSYTAISTPGNISVTKTTGLPTPGSTGVISITGLTKGQPYTFTVYATNPIGNSSISAASSTVIPADAPSAPTINLVTSPTANTGTTGSVIVNYSAPSDTGGAIITSHTAVSTPGSITASVSTPASGTITVTGLTKGTAYTFIVYATNRVGNSVNSNTSLSITPLTVPAAPTIGIPIAIGPTSATVAYTAPTDTGGTVITNYVVWTANGEGDILQPSQTITSPGVTTVTGLTKGDKYYFRVYANNSIGQSAASALSNSITTWSEPGPPAIGTATEVNATTVTIAFTAAPFTGGTPVLDFTATAYLYPSGTSSGVSVTGTASPITITGLTQGTTYTIKVVARNSVGTGTASSSSNTVQPADKPSKPTAPTVSTSSTYTADGRVTITFTAPYDGGTTITDYYFVSSPATTTQTVSQAAGGTFLFTGLVKGTAYTFAYAAKNRINTGTYSNYSSSITPLTVPSAPGIGSALRYDATSVNVAYTNSNDNGGTAITGYTATSTPGNVTGTSIGNPILVTGLTKGTAYTFTVHANNARGSSIESSPSNSATPATVPNAPTIGTATTISKNSASVSYTAPADNGGNAIISYTAVSSPSGISNTITQAGSGTITLTGLNPATNYTFVVYATNTYGASANSGSSNQITTTNSYAVSASPATINETSNRTVTFTIDTIGIANGTTMYWTNTGTTSATDFTDAVNDGSFAISANAAIPPVGTYSLSRTTVTDLNTEGPETVIFNLQYPLGTTLASTTVNVNDTSLTPTPTYSITANKTYINETTDKTITYSISTTYVTNGTVLWWEIYSAGGVNSSDFTASTITGSVTISGATGTPQTGGTAAFSLTSVEDHLTEGQESFFAYLGTNSPASSYNLVTSGISYIQDTSLPYGVVTLSSTSYSLNIPKTGLSYLTAGSFVVTMSSGTPGTITPTDIGGTNVFASTSITPSSRTFIAVSQTQLISWELVQNAVDYSNTSYTKSIGVLLDTSNGTYPTHTITLNRIAYLESVTISPTSGNTNTTFTYTVTGAPGTQYEYWNNINGYGIRTTVTLSGSPGDAGYGSATATGVFWTVPGTYTEYIHWFATDHGHPSGGFSTGYATSTSVSVTVTYPPLVITPGFVIGTFWQLSQPGPWGASQLTFTASGGSGSGYSFSTSGLPSGLSQNSSTGTVTGTPADGTSTTSVTTVVTDSAGNTASSTHTIYISGYPAFTSYSLTGSKTAFTVGEFMQVSWYGINLTNVYLYFNGSVVSDGSSGSRYVPNPSAGITAVYLYPLFFNGAVYYTNSVTLSYTVYAAPTVTFGSTDIAPPYNSSTSSSTTVRAGTNAYYNWTTTGATSAFYYINTNGGAYVGPINLGSLLQGPSGPQRYLEATATVSATQSIYLIVYNAAGGSATSSTASITWTPYTESLSNSPTSILTTGATTVTITGGYPNDTVYYSINDAGYGGGTVTLDGSGNYTNTSGYSGSSPGTYTLYVKFGTTTHTRQAAAVTVNYPSGTPNGGQYCNGTTLQQDYWNGSGGLYTSIVAYNSPTCGYVPPAATITIRAYGDTSNITIVWSTTNAGSTSWDNYISSTGASGSQYFNGAGGAFAGASFSLTGTAACNTGGNNASKTINIGPITGSFDVTV